jgi:hypothetical protein
MNREQLHDALTQLVEADGTPTSEQLRSFRKQAGRRRMLRRTVSFAAVCVIVLTIGGAAALAKRDSSPSRVVSPADTTPTSVAYTEPVTVTAIGDGVMLGAAQPLIDAIDVRLGNPPEQQLTTVDATENRQLSDGVVAIQEAKNAGVLGQVVIVHLGTNGTVDPADVQRMMSLLADRQQIIVVNAKVPRPWEQQVNDSLAASVTKFPNVVFLDWREYGLAHPEFFYDDGIHLRPGGATAYADFIASALTVGDTGEKTQAGSGSMTSSQTNEPDADASAIPPGRYRYVKVTGTRTATSIGRDGKSYTALVPTTYEFWIGADGSGRVRTNDGDPTFLSPENEQIYNDAGRTDLAALATHRDLSEAPGEMHALDLSTLPTEPSQLRDALVSRTHTGPSDNAERLLEGLSDNLWLTYGPVRNSRALMSALSSTPGMGVTASHGMTIMAAEANGVRKEIWFDSETGEIRRKRQVIVDATIPYELHAPNGTVLEDATLQQVALLPSTDTTP